MTRSDIPSVVNRKTSLTIRQRLMPAITCSTTTRAPENSRLSSRSPTLKSWPLGFFWLSGQYALRLVALKTGVFVQRRVDWIGNLCLISRFLVVRPSCNCRTEIDHFVCRFVDQHDVLVRMGLLFAAVVLLLYGGIGGTLAAAFRAVQGQVWRPLKRQGAGRHLAGVALRRDAQIRQGVPQNGEQMMDPVVGLWLTQIELQSVQRLERVGLLVDQNEQEFVFKALQHAFGTAACTALPCCAL